MKRFSVILLILIAISMVFVSCNSEAASNSSDVAKVAVGLGSSKALSAAYIAESLPSANDLVWKYTASKGDDGFRTGATSVETAIRTDNNGEGLPLVIGQTGGTTLENVTSNTWFSTGRWSFNFYGYQGDVKVYEAEDVLVTVAPATQNNTIGGTANITLSIVNDPRGDCGVFIKEIDTTNNVPTLVASKITVDFGNGYDSSATYKLYMSDNGGESGEIATGTYNSTTKQVEFTSADALASYSGNALGGLHLLTFTVKKGTETVYASGEVFIIARKGYTWGISGDLASLESVAQVGINTVTVPNDTAQSTNTISIGNEAELKAFAAYVNQGNTCAGLTIELTQDITLTSAWTPIGNSYRGQDNGAYFAGTFDGQNHKISGLTNGTGVVKDNNGESLFGLFGVVKGATIKNLTLEDVKIDVNSITGTTGENIGALIGYSEGNLTVSNVAVTKTANGQSYVKGSNVGGLIGRVYGNGGNAISITGCSNAADVTAVNGSENKAKAAGIVGFINTNGCSSASITGCTNTGAISSTATGHVIASGIANYGFQATAGTVETITITGTNSGDVAVSSGAALTSTDSIAALCSYKNAEDTISINPSNN